MNNLVLSAAKPPMSRYTRTLLSLIVADCLLILFITFGSVFPRRMDVSQPGTAMPDSYYDYSAKVSPFPQQRARKPVTEAVRTEGAERGRS